MNHYEPNRTERTTESRWLGPSALSAIVGGVLLALTGVALLSVLNETEFAYVEPVGIVAILLVALGFPALYASEHRRFGRLATAGFWTMTVGWVVAAVALPVGTYGPGIAFLATVLGWLVALVGALAFGVALLRDDATRTPRLAAWLLVAALPVGVPFTVAFTTYVMGEGADPWAAPLLLFGLAWVVFGRFLRSTARTETSLATD